MTSSSAFLSFTADSITPAHIALIEKACTLGEVTVGVMSDAALWGNRALPVLTVEERANLISHLKGVSRVVVQDQWSYVNILEKLKPDFFIHGSSWDRKNSPEEVRGVLGKWQGRLVEIPFREDLSWVEPSHRASALSLPGSSTQVPSADSRRASLGRILRFNRPVLALEAHNPLSAMVAESVKIVSSQRSELSGGQVFFDALWSSSLTDSTSRAYPDIEALSFDSRVSNIREIFRVSSRPLVMDLDTGGEPEILAIRVQELETIGVSAGVIEDKVGLKKNSLLGNSVTQYQSSIEDFSRKIRHAKNAQRSRDFLLVARVESLILEAGMVDALDRSHAYIEAGADAVMIHSRERDPGEIFQFLKLFREVNQETPIVLVPTSYTSVTARNLYERGANLVIYANHMLRAAIPAMRKVAEQILRDGKTDDIEGQLLSVNEILNIIPGTN